MPDTIYRTAFVLPVTSPPIRDAFVAVRDGVVTGMGSIGDRPRGPHVEEIDLGATILMPGFVNAHTHLELSHLEGAVPGNRGFVTWIEDQLRARAERSTDEVLPAIRKAIAALQAGGTVAVADVSNSLATVSPLRESGLHALVLHEILGFDPAKASHVLEQTKAARAALSATPIPATSVRIEVAAHAPHSISRELFALLLKDGGVKSIHVAESRSEDDFRCSNSILKSPMCVENYVASLKHSPVTDGNRTFAECWAEFDAPPGREQALANQIGQGVFQAAFDHLKARFR